MFDLKKDMFTGCEYFLVKNETIVFSVEVYTQNGFIKGKKVYLWRNEQKSLVIEKICMEIMNDDEYVIREFVHALTGKCFHQTERSE